jgi:hypothetical protein
MATTQGSGRNGVAHARAAATLGFVALEKRDAGAPKISADIAPGMRDAAAGSPHPPGLVLGVDHSKTSKALLLKLAEQIETDLQRTRSSRDHLNDRLDRAQKNEERRCAAIARTHVETGAMFIVKAMTAQAPAPAAAAEPPTPPAAPATPGTETASAL